MTTPTSPETRTLDRLPRIAMAVAILVGLGVIFAVARHEFRERASGQPGSPLLFVLSAEHGRNLTVGSQEVFRSFVRQKTGLEVEFRVATSSLEALQFFESEFDGHGDLGLLPLFDYALARHQYGVSAGLQVLRGTASSEYAGVLVVRSNAAETSFTQLAGKRLAYADPFSTSGFIYPASMLAEAGIEVEPSFAGGHRQAVDQVLAGNVDAAATYEAAANDSRIRILAHTPPIPNEPIFFRQDLRPEKRQALEEAILAFAQTPEGRDFFLAAADITGVRTVGDEGYEATFGAIRAAGKRVYDVVPEGTRLEAENRSIELLF